MEESRWFLSRTRNEVPEQLARLALVGMQVPSHWGVYTGNATYVGDCATKLLKTQQHGTFWVGPVTCTPYFNDKRETCCGCKRRHGRPHSKKAKIRVRP